MIEFPPIYLLLVHSTNITKNLYVISGTVLGTEKNPKLKKELTGSWHFEQKGILILIRSNHLIFLWKKLRSREMKCFTSDGQSADHCPRQVWSGGAKIPHGPLWEGPDTPLRVASSAGPESLWLGHADVVVLVHWDLVVQGKQQCSVTPQQCVQLSISWLALLLWMQEPLKYSFGSRSSLESIGSLKVTDGAGWCSDIEKLTPLKNCHLETFCSCGGS